MLERWRKKVAVGLAAVAILLLSGPSARAEATVMHIYELDGSTGDFLGGPSLTLAGGVLTPTGYVFLAGQGPSVSNAIDPTTYSIEMLFSIDQTVGYRKLLDFKDRTSDRGLYNFSTSLEFFPFDFGPSGVILPGVLTHVVLTRDATTNQVIGYVNGVQQFAFLDTGGDATFTGPNNIIHFLRDDLVVTGEESSGVLDRVRLYDGVLTAAQVVDLFQGGDPPGLPTGIIPEPASLTLLGLGVAGLIGYRWRRRAA